MAKAVLTVTAANPALTYAVTGLVDGDPASVVSGTAALTTTATPTSPLGSYPITFSTKGLAANYSFTYVAGTLTILPPCVIGTTTTLVINPSTNLVAGEPITLTATVTPASGTSTPSGTLTFKIRPGAV